VLWNELRTRFALALTPVSMASLHQPSLLRHREWPGTIADAGRTAPVLGGLAEFQRSLILARTSDGRSRATTDLGAHRLYGNVSRDPVLAPKDLPRGLCSALSHPPALLPPSAPMI
jgi:hypothetical protein